MNSPIRFNSNLEDLCHPISKIACNSFHLCKSIYTMDFSISQYKTKHEINMLAHINLLKISMHKMNLDETPKIKLMSINLIHC